MREKPQILEFPLLLPFPYLLHPLNILFYSHLLYLYSPSLSIYFLFLFYSLPYFFILLPLPPFSVPLLIYTSSSFASSFSINHLLLMSSHPSVISTFPLFHSSQLSSSYLMLSLLSSYLLLFFFSPLPLLLSPAHISFFSYFTINPLSSVHFSSPRPQSLISFPLTLSSISSLLSLHSHLLFPRTTIFSLHPPHLHPSFLFSFPSPITLFSFNHLYFFLCPLFPKSIISSSPHTFPSII